MTRADSTGIQTDRLADTLEREIGGDKRLIRPFQAVVRAVKMIRSGAPGMESARRALQPLMTPAWKRHLEENEGWRPGAVACVAGGCDPETEKKIRTYRECLHCAFEDFEGTVFSGGTAAGVPGLVGLVAATIKKAGRKKFTLIGYLPAGQRALADPRRYDRIYETGGSDFSPLEPIQNWIDLIGAGVDPAAVRVLGINGGPIAAFEYRLAHVLGAVAGVFESSGRAADEILEESRAWPAGQMAGLPRDPFTVRAFANGGATRLSWLAMEFVASAIHQNFLDENRHKEGDPAMVPWNELRGDLKQSNRDQARYAEQTLRKAGYALRAAPRGEAATVEFTTEEVELMAEMEHGRWNADRLLSGWTFARERDPARKKSPYIVPWKKLPDAIREYDRQAVRNFPRVFARAGLVVYPAEKEE